MIATLSDKYTSSEKGANLFITFIFILFFFQFFRNFILEQPIEKQIVFIQTILISIWYGLTLMIT
jgi:hypothetical protein